eukprot:Opistho-2@71380
MSGVRLPLVPSAPPQLATTVVRGEQTLVRAVDLSVQDAGSGSGASNGNVAVSHLSAIDAVMPRSNILVVYVYEYSLRSGDADGGCDADGGVVPISLLKDSLSHALSFYPQLAGRMRQDDCGKLSVALSNEGAVLFDASCPHPLSILLPYRTESLPDAIASKIDPIEVEQGHSPLLKIQRTRFSCGGVTIAVAMHHSLADGDAFFMFMNDLAMISRQLRTGAAVDVSIPDVVCDRSSQIPPPGAEAQHTHIEYKIGAVQPSYSLASIDKIFESLPAMRTVELLFSRAELDLMKATAAARETAADGDRETPLPPWVSTNDALVAHVWAAVTRARLADPNSAANFSPDTKCGMACNGRKRLCPPLADRFFGNSNYYACAIFPLATLASASPAVAAAAIRTAVDRMDDAYMRDARAFIYAQEDARQVMPSFNIFLGPDIAITNWANFPIYGCDYGWGRPEYVGIGSAKFDGLGIVMDAPPSLGLGGGAVKITLGLKSEHMNALLADPQFRPFRYASSTPIL